MTPEEQPAERPVANPLKGYEVTVSGMKKPDTKDMPEAELETST